MFLKVVMLKFIKIRGYFLINRGKGDLLIIQDADLKLDPNKYKSSLELIIQKSRS